MTRGRLVVTALVALGGLRVCGGARPRWRGGELPGSSVAAREIHSRHPADPRCLLPIKVQQVDRALSGLVRDLKQRGLFDETLIVWGGEFGRTPMAQNSPSQPFIGRDHHPYAFTVLLAGGGIRGGQTFRPYRRHRLLHHRKPDGRARPPGTGAPPAGSRPVEADLSCRDAGSASLDGSCRADVPSSGSMAGTTTWMHGPGPQARWHLGLPGGGAGLESRGFRALVAGNQAGVNDYGRPRVHDAEPASLDIVPLSWASHCAHAGRPADASARQPQGTARRKVLQGVGRGITSGFPARAIHHPERPAGRS